MAHLNLDVGNRNKRDFYRIHRDSICYAIGLRNRNGKRSTKLPTSDKDPLFSKGVQNWYNLKLYSIAPWYLSDWSERPSEAFFTSSGREAKPIAHYFTRSAFVGEFNVRLLPFTPAYDDRGLTPEQRARGDKGRRVKTSSQRLEVQCPLCQGWIPFSRLNQHMYSRKGVRTKTCTAGVKAK